MSIAGDLLTTATPARLLCRRGTWVLEVVRLVPIERNVFQPRVQRLEGADAVLQYLKRSGDSPALAAAASQLMRGPRSEEERSFDAVEGEWVLGEAGSNKASSRPSAPPANAGEIGELRAELLVLRASHERMRERVQRLEAQLSRSAPAHDVLSVPPTPAVVMPKPSEPQRPPQARAAAPLQAHSAPQTRSERAAAERPMTLPEVASINACLRSLIGESSGVHEKSPVNFSATDLGPCWLTRLIDEAGHEVGAIVADQAATATLGGALIALPAHEIEAQRAQEMPTQDVIGAMSEALNQLCETINMGSLTVQVRVKPIELLLPGVLDWTSAASGALELELADGFGRLFLFAR